MIKISRITGILAVVATAVMLAGCTGSQNNAGSDTDTAIDLKEDVAAIENEATVPDSNSNTDKEVDVIFFMGESNMSGFGGDASLAPHVSEDAGMEFRAVTDPTTFHPIKEPFGENEARSSGLDDFPGAKKGSLVSSFINEYHDITGRRIVAVSASMGSTDMDKWTSEGIMNDVKLRYDDTMSFLDKKGLEARHIYVVWQHGESDGLKGAAESTYKEAINTVMDPLFKKRLENLFIITPGRTIDSVDAYINVINAQIDLCKEDKHYAIATTALTAVSTECMTDQYQYNQHALNYIGKEAAKAVAYFTEHGVEKIVYDFKHDEWIVPKGVKEDSQEKEDPIHPSDIDINSDY